MGVIQSQINNGLSTISFLTMQTPRWKEGAETQQGKQLVKKSEKLENLNQKEESKIFPTDKSYEADDAIEKYNDYYKKTNELRTNRADVVNRALKHQPLNQNLLKTKERIEQENFSYEEGRRHLYSTNSNPNPTKKSYVAPAAEFVQQRHMQMKYMRHFLGLAEELKKGVNANGQNTTIS